MNKNNKIVTESEEQKAYKEAMEIKTSREISYLGAKLGIIIFIFIVLLKMLFSLLSK